MMLTGTTLIEAGFTSELYSLRIEQQAAQLPREIVERSIDMMAMQAGHFSIISVLAQSGE